MRALAALSLSSTMRSETRQSSELATLPTKAISNDKHTSEKRKICFEESKEIELHKNEVKASFKKSKCRSTLRKTIPRRTKS